MIAAQHDEVLRLRDADDQAAGDLTVAENQNHVPGAERLIGVVASTSTAANVFFRITVCQVLGNQAEGSPGSLTSSTVTILAYNLGSKVPAVGSIVMCVKVPYRWVFSFGAPAVLTVSDPPPTPPTAGPAGPTQGTS